MEIQLTILGEPKSQARHRHFSRGKFHGTYDPSAKEKDKFFSVIQNKAPKTPLDGPLWLSAIFYMQRPKSHYGTGKNTSVLKNNAPEYHVGRPDYDNLAKLICDAMNKVFWRDDSQIAVVNIEKVYDEKPRTEIIVKTL